MEQTSRIGYFDSHIVHENFGDEIVVINLKSGVYYSLSKTGQFIWDLIQYNPTREEIIHEIKQSFDTDHSDIAEDIVEFLNELAGEELIKELDTDQKTTAVNKEERGNKGRYEKPVLNKYTDQKELLLLDPIHEVDDLGWPEKSDEEDQQNDHQA